MIKLILSILIMILERMHLDLKKLLCVFVALLSMFSGLNSLCSAGKSQKRIPSNQREQLRRINSKCHRTPKEKYHYKRKKRTAINFIKLS